MNNFEYVTFDAMGYPQLSLPLPVPPAPEEFKHETADNKEKGSPRVIVIDMFSDDEVYEF